MLSERSTATKRNGSLLTLAAIQRTFGQTLLAGFVLYFATFFVLLPIVCRSLPYSKYFYLSQSSEIQLYGKISANQQRSEIANKYFEKVDPKKTINFHGEGLAKRPEIVIGVISVARNMHYRGKEIKPFYLTQVLTRLDIILKTSKNADARVFICNVNSNPVENQEAEILANYFPRVRKFNVERKPKPNNLRQRDGLFEKKKSDHVFCLSKALEYKSKYVLLLEDDALPKADFYPNLLYLLRNQLENRIVLGDHSISQSWSWAKLCQPEELADFLANSNFIIEWLCSSTFLAGLVTLLFYFLYPRKNTYEHYLVLLMGFFYFLALFWVIGRPHFVEFFYSSQYFLGTRPDTECCTQAVLYRSHILPDLIKYLDTKLCSEKFPLDAALQNYLVATNSKGYLSVPNLFSHIGIYSSLNSV